MSKQAKTVDHLGKVQEITTSDVLVKILSQSACASCHSKQACSISDMSEKVVVVHKPNHNFFVGQDVKVILKQSLGFKATFIAYVVPFLMMLLTLIVLTAAGISEGKAGLAALSVLGPYFIILYMLRDRISKQFTFDIESI